MELQTQTQPNWLDKLLSMFDGQTRTTTAPNGASTMQQTSPFMQTASFGMDAFNSYLAYQNYMQQRKMNKFNMNLGRANYTAQAKAYNSQVTDDARQKYIDKGYNTSAIDSYLSKDESYKKRLVGTSL
jgi:hypothetical protein